MRLTQDHVRAVMLGAQGLLTENPTPATKEDVLQAIRRMGALQIDTINVVARSPYLVLWSRLGAYEPGWLDELLADGALFEYWSHAACYLPIEDYGLYRRRMLEGHPRHRAWLAEHPDSALRVLEFLRREGEVRSADFERTDGRTTTWWDWKPEKTALECLHSTGEVMIARRDPNFHRVYALREQVLPNWDDASLPASDEVNRALVARAVRALGVSKAGWVPDYFRMPKRGTGAILEDLVGRGELRRVQVDGWDAPGYVHRANMDLVERVVGGAVQQVRTTLLSPFDPLTWDRLRVLELFDFDYRIEVYTPEARRKYGYFSLPVLHRGKFVARLDAKAFRREGRFVVRALHFEEGIDVTDAMVTELSTAVRACAEWHGTPEVELVWTNRDLSGSFPV